ncbi:hypothetical protein, partial [Enterococcus faecalis]|uniref:hypothetical protein n=1 Tax=Enterococcus faecalis TaxID=1351 RepID=UPI0021E0B6AD
FLLYNFSICKTRMYFIKRKHFLLSFFVMILTLLTFFSGTSSHAEGKQYTIGTDLTFAPFEFQDSK